MPVLDAAAQRREQGGDGQRRDHDRQRRLRDAGQRAEQPLQEHHAAEVDQRQQRGQRGVDQRLADDDVDVPQPIAQDGNAQSTVESKLDRNCYHPIAEEVKPEATKRLSSEGWKDG